jgi:hypothetical protein
MAREKRPRAPNPALRPRAWVQFDRATPKDVLKDLAAILRALAFARA